MLSGDLDDYIEKIGIHAVPRVLIKINGSDFIDTTVPQELKLVSVDVDMSVDSEASICNVAAQNLNFLNFTAGKSGDVSYSLAESCTGIKIGSKMEVYIGYSDNLMDSDKVWVGYVSGFDYKIRRISSSKRAAINEPDVLDIIIRGMDGKIWLMSSKKSDLKKGINKYTKAISNTLNSYKSHFETFSNIKVSNEPRIEVPIYQNNQSDYEFICDCSRRLGAWFFIDKGTVNVVRPNEKKSQSITIGASPYIVEMDLSTNIVGIPKSVSVFGFSDEKPKKATNATVSDATVVGNGQAPSKLTTRLSSTANVINIIDDTVTSPDQAKFIGQSEFIRRSMELCSVHAKMFGVQEISLFASVKLKNWGNPLDNEYVVTKIKHNYYYRTPSFTTEIYLAAAKYNPQGGFGADLLPF